MHSSSTPDREDTCHMHTCKAHTLCDHSTLWATATLTSSSESGTLTDVIGGAASQSPECADDAAIVVVVVVVDDDDDDDDDNDDDV